MSVACGSYIFGEFSVGLLAAKRWEDEQPPTHTGCPACLARSLRSFVVRLESSRRGRGGVFSSTSPIHCDPSPHLKLRSFPLKTFYVPELFNLHTAGEERVLLLIITRVLLHRVFLCKAISHSGFYIPAQCLIQAPLLCFAEMHADP